MIFLTVMKNKLSTVEVLLILLVSTKEVSVLRIDQIHFHIPDYLIYVSQFSLKLVSNILLDPSPINKVKNVDICSLYICMRVMLSSFKKNCFQILEVPPKGSSGSPGRAGAKGIHFMWLVCWSFRGSCSKTQVAVELCVEFVFFSFFYFALILCFVLVYMSLLYFIFYW